MLKAVAFRAMVYARSISSLTRQVSSALACTKALPVQCTKHLAYCNVACICDFTLQHRIVIMGTIYHIVYFF